MNWRETPRIYSGFFNLNIMKNLFKANSEYMSTQKELKPFLCQNDNGLYFVSILFSKEHIESRGIKIIK